MDSLSLYIDYNLTRKQFLDTKLKPLEGEKIGKDKKTIYRFRNGYLDGDIYDMNGRFITVKPAVETTGHVEYWRANKLHRDNNEPAVISDSFKKKEYWQNGIFIKAE